MITNEEVGVVTEFMIIVIFVPALSMVLISTVIVDLLLTMQIAEIPVNKKLALTNEITNEKINYNKRWLNFMN
jgi:hypothetical protein